MNFLSLLVTFLPLVFATTEDDLRWYYPADYWAYSPQLKMSNYNRYPLSNELIFYEDKTFKGKPAFTLVGSFATFADGEECQLDLKRELKKSKRWVNCTPYLCNVLDGNESKEVEIINPYEREWIVHDGTGKRKRTLCSKQIDAKVSQPYSFTNDTHKYLVIDANVDQVVSLNSKKYYPDLSFCKKELIHKCMLGLKAETASDNFKNHISQFNQTTSRKYLAHFGKCFEKKGKELDQCLKSYTYKDTDDPNRDNFPFRDPSNPPTFWEIQWTDENKRELQACLKGPGIGPGLLKGIKKKCYFIDRNIAIIEYPEAFVQNQRLVKRRSNFELKELEY